jgi:hypothetical protein
MTPTPELERMARAIWEATRSACRRPDLYPPWTDAGRKGREITLAAARAALQSLLPVSDETVEAMGRAWVNNDPFVAPQPSHVLGLKNALTAAINHILTGGAE